MLPREEDFPPLRESDRRLLDDHLWYGTVAEVQTSNLSDES
jgi:hypothetical protein